MAFDHTDMYLTVPAWNMCCETSTLGDPAASANEQDLCLCQQLKEYVKTLVATRDHGVLASYERRLAVASRKQEDLMNAIALKERYISQLRNILDNWITMTGSARQMLGRYHTREDILGTLRYEEDALRLLRYRINSVGYEITALG